MKTPTKHSFLFRLSGVVEAFSFLVCCLVFVLGIWHVSVSFLGNIGHPGWDFTLRYGEVTCLTDLHTDPYDIFTGVATSDKYLPYQKQYERLENALDYRWCAGYPPWEYTLLLPVSLLSLRSADAIYKTLELVSLFVVLIFSYHRSSKMKCPTWAKLFFAASFLLLPVESWCWVFRYGNWPLLFCAGVVALIICLDNGRQILAGFVWSFLMIKPQQGIWFAIPLLFRRQFKTIGVAVTTCLVASIPPAVLCGKSPIDLILEIPKFRLYSYFESSFFPPDLFRFLGDMFFPRAPLVIGGLVCLLMCLWCSWRMRQEKDWFVFLQPTLFCICAGYPLWRQDWIFYIFPLLFLIEIANGRRIHLRWFRIVAAFLCFCVVNPVPWIELDFSYPVPFFPNDSEMLALSTWTLLVFLIIFGFCQQSQSSVKNEEIHP